MTVSPDRDHAAPASGPGAAGRVPHPAFRDRRLDLVVAVVALLLSVGGFVRVAIAHRDFVAAHPQNLAWVALSLLLGGATFLANGHVALRDRRLVWAGYGLFAMLAGFNLQGLVNGSIARAFPPAERGLLVYLALGIGAGACQTFGKWLMVRVIDRVHAPTGRVAVVAAGLAVGLGFGLGEVLFIGGQILQSGTAISGIGAIGIWERTSAVGFHIYSSGLIAIGIALGRWWPILFVLALHSVEDWLAGAVGSGVLRVDHVALETFYSVATISVWVLFRRAARQVPA